MPRCKNCRKPFEPRFSTFEKFCWDVQCKTLEGLQKVRERKDMEAKKQRKELKQRKTALETIQQKVKRVQKVVNEYIRKRDKGKPCISCNKILAGKFDAGHYYNSNNHWSIRFDTANIHGQCVRCNRDLHGSLIEYRKKLIHRIGEDELMRLDGVCHNIRKFTKDELETIMTEFKTMIKEMP